MLYSIISPAIKIAFPSIFVYKYLKFNYPEEVEDFKLHYFWKPMTFVVFFMCLAPDPMLRNRWRYKNKENKENKEIKNH
jgi:hypothetical protein